MTQAYNLAILANAVDTSGKLNVGTNATGTLPVANGGTGTTTPSLVGGTNISITGTWPNQTVTNTSSASGTVTSVATGNGLQGGTITTSGTLSVACPTFNTVGSYVFGGVDNNNSSNTLSAGSNYSAGSGAMQVRSAILLWNFGYNDVNFANWNSSVNLSGTWKWMGANNGTSVSNNGLAMAGLFCRVS